MCRFYSYCDKPCKSIKTHDIHWTYIRTHCQKKDPAFLNYNVYKRLLHVDEEDMETLLIDKKRQKCGISTSIHREKYEKYLIKNMVEKMIENIIDSIP